jgi:hypothetical protein
MGYMSLLETKSEKNSSYPVCTKLEKKRKFLQSSTPPPFLIKSYFLGLLFLFFSYPFSWKPNVIDGCEIV